MGWVALRVNEGMWSLVKGVWEVGSGGRRWAVETGSGGIRWAIHDMHWVCLCKREHRGGWLKVMGQDKWRGFVDTSLAVQVRGHIRLRDFMGV